ncbi:Kunitz-type serine protease inhibitor textilinin-3 [Orchesella cincta]|uniref:Kunitz-type serine protease inhibitor textilinin-3 n=1 Tax=Orchesella cincta TaxID=48709 RepID=A0A1D2MVQ9_ORCCI|nr:Kunitz-type serine protease inhibitor textilinin-3 [Orchesella cincta]
MCRLGILETWLILIVTFIFCVSNAEGSVSSTIKRNTHSREFYNEDYDADSNVKEMVFLRQVHAHDLDESVVVEGHNNIKQSESSSSMSSVNDDFHKGHHHRSTRAVDVDLSNKNTVMAEEYTGKTQSAFDVKVNNDSPASNQKELDSGGNVPANAPGDKHEDLMIPDHDDDDAAHDYAKPQFEEASASAFHKIVQIREFDDHDQASGENDYAEHFGHTSHALRKRSTLSGVRADRSEQKEKADLAMMGKLLAVARQKKEEQSLNENGDKDKAIDIDINQRFPSSFCQLEKSDGNVCSGLGREITVQQFYYDPRKNQCIQFTYSGCGGNANRFSSVSECSRACVDPKLKNKRVENGKTKLFPSKWYN